MVLIEKNHGHALLTGSQFSRKYGDRNGQEVIEEKNESPEERDQVAQGKDREAGEQAQEAQEKAEKGKITNSKAPAIPGLLITQVR
jgi:hypothetical protein